MKFAVQRPEPCLDHSGRESVLRMRWCEPLDVPIRELRLGVLSRSIGGVTTQSDLDQVLSDPVQQRIVVAGPFFEVLDQESVCVDTVD